MEDHPVFPKDVCKNLLVLSKTLSQKEDSEDTNGAIRIRKPKKDRQHNNQITSANNNLQNTTENTKDRATRTPQEKQWLNACAPEK